LATRTQRTKVGIFLLLSAALIIGGLLIIAGYRQGERYDYVVIFDKSILGLYKGGTVQYMGVPVGTVDDIYVNREGKANVDLVIDPTKVILHKGVEASLEYYSFATGTMCIALKGGDPDAEELPPGSIIPTGSSLIDSVSNQASDLMETFKRIAEKIDEGLEDMPEGELTRIVQEIKPFIEESKAFVADARETLKSVQGDIHGVVEDARPGIKKLTTLADNANKLSNTANETLVDLRAKIDQVELDKIQTQIVDLTGNLKETTVRINGMTESFPYTVENVSRALMETLTKLNETLESVRQLAETLDDNPYVRGGAAREE
jgi:phospholipid/cholesterol/gamma-HCH transport system substrate-binding protein